MSTPLKQKITFIVMTPVVVNLSFKTFQSEFNGTEEMWIRLLEKAGGAKEFVEQSMTGLYLSVTKDNSDIVTEAEDFVTSFIEDKAEEVRDEIEEEAERKREEEEEEAERKREEEEEEAERKREEEEERQTGTVADFLAFKAQEDAKIEEKMRAAGWDGEKYA